LFIPIMNIYCILIRLMALLIIQLYNIIYSVRQKNVVKQKSKRLVPPPQLPKSLLLSSSRMHEVTIFFFSNGVRYNIVEGIDHRRKFLRQRAIMTNNNLLYIKLAL